MADYPSINGVALEGASVKIRILGKYYRGIQSIAYGDAMEPNHVYELGSSEPIAMTRGQYKPEDVSFEILRERADEIRADAAAQNKAWGLVPVEIHVHYDEEGQAPRTDVIYGARVTKVGNDAKAGADALIEKWTMKPMRISRNGVFLHRK